MHLLWQLVAFVFVFGPAGAEVEGTPIPEHAGGCAALRPGKTTLGEVIAVTAASRLADPILEEAVAVWRQCANYGHDFPFLEARRADDEAPAGRLRATSSLEVRVESGLGLTGRCGEFRGRTITLYPSARTSSGRVKSCGSLALNLAHELGHALGLGDGARGPACERGIMAGVSSRNGHLRAVTAEECRLVGSRWLTFAERRPESEVESVPAAAPALAGAVTFPASVAAGIWSPPW